MPTCEVHILQFSLFATRFHKAFCKIPVCIYAFCKIPVATKQLYDDKTVTDM